MDCVTGGEERGGRAHQTTSIYDMTFGDVAFRNFEYRHWDIHNFGDKF